MKQKFRRAHLAAAKEYAKLSSARRLQVGAIVVKDDRIISIGYNGTPEGWDNNCEDEVVASYAGFEGAIHQVKLVTKPEVIHAEGNAIAKLAKSNESGKDAVMFLTHSPCMECAKLIYTSGISCVYYEHEYRNLAGIEFLRKCGIPVKKIAEDGSEVNENA